MLREVSEVISSAGGRTANRPSINLGYRFDYQLVSPRHAPQHPQRAPAVSHASRNTHR
jgi:hypothetical protein